MQEVRPSTHQEFFKVLTAWGEDMQAMVVNNEKVHEELGKLGLSSMDIETLSGSSIPVTVKLRNLPVAVIPLMKNEADTANLDVVLSRRKKQGKPVSEAILIGPKGKMRAFCDNLLKNSGDAATLGKIISNAFEGNFNNKNNKLILGNHHFNLGEKTLIMGILNVTPDSFSDGGQNNQLESALDRAFRMVEEGADIIDIGGESTRPGSDSITIDEELKRVMPVIEALKKDSTFKNPLSIDTYKAAVAEKALSAGVEMLNDVWGFKKSGALGKVAAHYNVPVCLMHNRDNTDYDDLIPDIILELEESINIAYRSGVKDSQVIIDPGIGFGKNLEQNLEVMKQLSSFCNLGYPLLLGTSRKSMIGKTLDLPVEERVEGTAATVAYGIAAGADIVRVHDVKEMSRVAKMTDAMVRR